MSKVPVIFLVDPGSTAAILEENLRVAETIPGRKQDLAQCLSCQDLEYANILSLCPSVLQVHSPALEKVFLYHPVH